MRLEKIRSPVLGCSAERPRSCSHAKAASGPFSKTVVSAGFVLIGAFTSHATGNVGRLANDTALGIYAAALAALLLVVSYALVTRVSGPVVRTTHLTGVITDLGIESARWLRFMRHAWRDSTRSLLASGVERLRAAKLGIGGFG